MISISRSIPSTGETLPVIGLGTWQAFDISNSATERATRSEVLKRFVELGGTLVDSSPMYGNAESVVGELAANAGVGSKLFVATKVWTTGRAAGVQQMERSMKLLRVARLDLMQVHNLVDCQTHLATLREWKQAGRVRYIGVTHYTASGYAELERVLNAETVDFVQLNYSLEERDAERRLLPLAQERGIAVIVNRPFAAGAMLRHARGKPLPAWATEVGCSSWAALFLKWIVGHPAITCVIPATSQPDHLAQNMEAGQGPVPDAALRERIAAAA